MLKKANYIYLFVPIANMHDTTDNVADDNVAFVTTVRDGANVIARIANIISS